MNKFRAVLFTNWTDRDFSHKWDGQKFEFAPSQSIMLDEGIAKHFAKHLAVRELNRLNKSLDRNNIREMAKKALGTAPVVQAETKTDFEIKKLNVDKDELIVEKEELIKDAEEKGIKVDKRKSAENIKKEIEEFEGLTEE